MDAHALIVIVIRGFLRYEFEKLVPLVRRSRRLWAGVVRWRSGYELSRAVTDDLYLWGDCPLE
jgi:hypothetical protein